MYAASFQLESFESLPVDVQAAMMGGLCEALSRIDAAYLLLHTVPRLYDSGVRYRYPQSGSAPQPWRDVPLILSSRFGACGELTAWRLAELRMFEGKSRVEPLVTVERATSDQILFHVVAYDPQTGRTECPSTILGMR